MDLINNFSLFIKEIYEIFIEMVKILDRRYRKYIWNQGQFHDSNQAMKGDDKKCKKAKIRSINMREILSEIKKDSSERFVQKRFVQKRFIRKICSKKICSRHIPSRTIDDAQYYFYQISIKKIFLGDRDLNKFKKLGFTFENYFQILFFYFKLDNKLNN